jgi:hypothetical protein
LRQGRSSQIFGAAQPTRYPLKWRIQDFVLGIVSTAVLLPLMAKEPSLVPTRNDVTLLTGPNLLSPASRPLNVPSISSEMRVGVDTPIEAAQKKRAAAEARLKTLRAEREAALARARGLRQLEFPPATNAGPLVDPIRFDAKLPETPVQLMPDASRKPVPARDR